MKATPDRPEGTGQTSQGCPGDSPSSERSDTWALLDRSPLPVVLFDKECIAEANAAAAELFGWSRESLLGRAVDSISSFRQPDGRAAAAGFNDRLGKALKGEEPQSFPWVFLSADGGSKSAEVNLSAFRRDGRSLAMGIIRDLTDEGAGVELDPRQAQKMELLGQLAGGIAHDFNNLLTAISGHLELALLPSTEEQEALSSIKVAQTCSLRAGSLTRRLLDFSRTRFSEPQTVLLDQVVRETSDFLRRLIRADIELNVEVSDASQAVFADVGQLEQAIMNLAVNAEAAMPDGGKLTLRTSRQEVDARFLERHSWAQEGQFVRLEIEDSGHGIPPEHQPHIFEPFFSSKPRERGTGLGLSIVYRIVKQHRGFIGVRSRPGFGTLFWILLPAAKSVAERVWPADRIETDKPKSVAPERKTIMVVEDEEVVRELAAGTLAAAGYTVLEAGSAEEAEELLGGGRRGIELLLTDLMLSGRSGYQLAAALRSSNPELKVIYTSGYDTEQLPFDVGTDPGSIFLEKPYSLAKLTATVGEMLRRS